MHRRSLTLLARQVSVNECWCSVLRGEVCVLTSEISMTWSSWSKCTGGPRVPYHQTVHRWATCPLLLSNNTLVGHVSLIIKQCTGGPRVQFFYQTLHWWVTCPLISNSALVGHVSTSLIKQCTGGPRVPYYQTVHWWATCPLLSSNSALVRVHFSSTKLFFMSSLIAGFL